MLNKPTTVTLFTEGIEPIVFTEISIADVASKLPGFNVRVPARIHFANIETGLYYDDISFCDLDLGLISLDELRDKHWCDGLCRNTVELRTHDGTNIDPDSLWMLRGDKVLLIDDDDIAYSPFTLDFFRMI